MRDEPIVHPITGWLWFLDLPAGGVVLDACGGRPETAEQFTTHFSEVEVLPPGNLTWEGPTFDCIALHEDVVRSIDLSDAGVPGLDELFSILKPGGWLVAASTNPGYVGGVRRQVPGIRPSRLTRMFRAAGFAEIRRAYVTPSLHRPTNLIPDTRKAVFGFESSASIQDHVSWKRRAVAGLGLRQMLYPAYFLMGRR